MEYKIHLLIVDDEPEIVNALRRVLKSLPVELITANSGDQALEKLAKDPADIMLTDLSMPGMDGIELCSKVAEKYPEMIRIMLTAYADLDNVITAINSGKIWGYLRKPWDNQELRICIQQAIQTQELMLERSLLRRTVEYYQSNKRDNFQGFIGNSMAMQFVYSAIEKSAPSQASVFITGKNGTGKEVAAKAIHDLSKRHDGEFVPLNCAAIPAELLESEVFGHLKGAFSGAVANRDGAASRANGGTLFLDEIGEMDINLQAKLLRFIQTGCFQRVGSDKLEQADIRFICATNRDPQQAINDNKLREDLYFRLNVISIDMPALKDREEDMLQLAQHFLAHFSQLEDKVFVGFSSDAEILLKQYHWPGNVRQLENLIHSAVIMSDGPLITSKCLAMQLKLSPEQSQNLSVQQPACRLLPPTSVSPQAEPTEYQIEPLAVVERRVIEQAIAHFDNNVVQAATALGVSPSTLYRKTQQWQDKAEVLVNGN